MRRYNILSGILLILSIIDFALAAPVSAQEKRQEHVNAVHIPKDVTTVLEERWEEDLEKLGEEYLKKGGKPVDSSSSASSGSDHGSTNAMQPPVVPNPASSTANPESLTDLSSCLSSTSSREGLQARGNCFGMPWDKVWKYLADDVPRSSGLSGDGYRPFREDWVHGPTFTQTPSLPVYSNHEFTWAQTVQRKKIPKIPVPKPRPLIHPLADPNFDWERWIDEEDLLPRPASPEGFGQAHKYQVDPLNPPSTSGHAPSPPVHEPEHEAVTPSPPSSNLGSPKEPEDEVVPEPKSSPDPELHLDHQSLSTESQPVDLQAAIYAAKGKAKESRHISGTAIDVGNAVQRELQPGERSLDQGE